MLYLQFLMPLIICVKIFDEQKVSTNITTVRVCQVTLVSTVKLTLMNAVALRVMLYISALMV